MIGILLASVATLIGEVGSAIGKREVQLHRETFLGMGFINLLWGVVLYTLLFLLVPTGNFLGDIVGEYRFSVELVPLSLFIFRFFLEVTIITLVLKAVIVATRATFSFLRVLTVPFLLLVDILIGYDISAVEAAGIGIIILTTLLLIGTHTIRKEGMWHIIAASMIAVVTITIYKFNITNYNSVLGEQLTMTTLLTIYLGIATIITTKKNPLRHFKRPVVVLQSFSSSMNSVLTSFAMVFAPASVILTARRSSAILWAIISGGLVFQEKKPTQKFVALTIMCAGLCMLAI